MVDILVSSFFFQYPNGTNGYATMVSLFNVVWTRRSSVSVAGGEMIEDRVHNVWTSSIIYSETVEQVKSTDGPIVKCRRIDQCTLWYDIVRLC